MATFTGMTLDLSVGSIEALGSLTQAYANTEFEIYEGFHIYNQVAIQVGVTVNLLTGDYEFVVEETIGHRGSNIDSPERERIGANLTWDNGAGAINGISIDDFSGVQTAESGQAVPPTIWVWNKFTKALVGDVFYGKDVAWVQSTMWMRDPTSPGVSDRFAFEFDPLVDPNGSSHERMLRSGMYGGAWFKTDGTFLRPDLRKLDNPFNCHRFFMENPSLSGRGSAGAKDVPELTHSDD